ncbi:MAG: hypothetical protein L6V81_05285 [Clostridium sp.]|nr:MAG: hypothetical protein L6V81_05285 [Clostridium sp.]
MKNVNKVDVIVFDKNRNINLWKLKNIKKIINKSNYSDNDLIEIVSSLEK